MTGEPLLPTHIKRPLPPPGNQRRFLRLTEKYVLAIVFMAFCLVFFGAVYLPSELGNELGDFIAPKVIGPHGEDDPHKDQDLHILRERINSDRDIRDLVNKMEQNLQRNKKQLSDLNGKLKELQHGDRVDVEPKDLPAGDSRDSPSVEDKVGGTSSSCMPHYESFRLIPTDAFLFLSDRMHCLFSIDRCLTSVRYYSSNRCSAVGCGA